MGRVAGGAGFEPTNAGIKIRCLKLLATPHYDQKSGAGEENRNNDLQGENMAPQPNEQHPTNNGAP